MNLPLLLIFGLATWRISNLLVEEDGPFLMFRRVRELTGIDHDEEGKPYMIPDNFLAQLLSCVWCTSMWVGAGWLILWLVWPDVVSKIAMAFAFSSIAIVIDKYLKGYQ